MRLNLNESNKKDLITEIKNKYLSKQDDLKNIFLMNETIFGENFYIKLENQYNDFETRVIYLVNELIDIEKLNDFLQIIRDIYPSFAHKIDIPKLELIDILKDSFESHREIFLRAYQLARPKRYTGAIESPDNATELISCLTIPKEEQQPYSYIEKFVGYLLKRELDLLLRFSLKKWAETNIKNYQKLVEILIQEERDREQQKSFLIVKISSKGRSYTMNAWEMIDPYKDGRPYLTCKPLKIQKRRDEVTDEITIKKDLSNFSKELKKFIDQCRNLQQIQIFLPEQLMCHAVDCHDLDLDGRGSKTGIGEEYEVIIRYLERLELPDNHIVKNKWLDKGDVFQQGLEKLAAHIFISSDDKSDYNTFDKRLQNDDTVRGVYFTNVIDEKIYPKNLFLSGIPLALWIRPNSLNSIDADSIKRCFVDKLLKKDNNEAILLRELPYQVKRERGKGNDISKHLCLLWDDPNLLPPKQNLTDKKI